MNEAASKLTTTANHVTSLHELALRTGNLQVRVSRCAMPLSELCGFAARNNPKRGFLFVSKVLGKHVPCTPAQMLDAQQYLVAQIAPERLHGALVIGMAETATGLGHGVFEVALKTSHAPGLYLQTTRYPLDYTEQIEFEEPHSHAVQQFLYMPEQAALRQRFDDARCVVLVDDEISTGQTLVNLVTALRKKNPLIAHVVLLCLTDFSEGAAEQRLRLVPGILSVATVAILHGAFNFDRDLAYSANAAAVAPAFAYIACRRGYLSKYSARLGIDAALKLPQSLLDKCFDLAGTVKGGHGRVLVLGTGEFMHAAFCLARALSELSVDAWVQSTSRSPILMGHDIAGVMTVPDPYGEGIANYLYNFDPAQFDQVFVVHETPRNAELLALCQVLQAHSVSLLDEDVVSIEQMNLLSTRLPTDTNSNL